MQMSNSIIHFKQQQNGKGHDCKWISTSYWVELSEKRINGNVFLNKHLDKQELNTFSNKKKCNFLTTGKRIEPVCLFNMQLLVKTI